VLEEGALARGAHARDLVQGVGEEVLGALGAVRPDGEAVRLVAQALDEVEDRVVVRQREGARLPRAPELLLAQVAVDALGDANHGDVVDPCSAMTS
jgi:hypothetical protein